MNEPQHELLLDPKSPHIGFLLADASRLMRKRFEHESRDIAMTAAQMKILARVWKMEGTSQARLANALDLEPITLCRHVDRMEAAGLVERRPDPADRRARQLFTTEAGRALLPDMRIRGERVVKAALRGVSEADVQTVIATLNTIIANLGEDGDRACDLAAAAQVTEDA
ncbi:MarR family winged helix-turn-helix transcriptional regulator [Mangrovicella endophytica]|uniref:MarR family winged helix-turn-helix transcriptional regulator n=1 Tax=Mangrovicella endophytica TaxID=2066697 RepID=UPI000C9E790F|nr:MarR family winged helix-turn-helix transcriptional regulator [Mangrovicella endophytica]